MTNKLKKLEPKKGGRVIDIYATEIGALETIEKKPSNPVTESGSRAKNQDLQNLDSIKKTTSQSI